MSNPKDRPRSKESWEQRYVDGDLPWDSGRPDVHLSGVVDGYGIEPGKALEVGCGTGTNAVWLAKRGFDVLGQDISETAIAKARARAAEAGVDCDFVAQYLRHLK